jgi:hypothetical protein
MAQAEVEIQDLLGRRLAVFTADVDPESASECAALLRSRARELRRPVEQLRLVTWTTRGMRRRLEYRA